LLSVIVDIILMTADPGVWIYYQTEYTAMGTFYVLMHATPVIIIFCYFQYITLEPDTGYQWAPFACRMILLG
jgi:hypothetical protein